MGACYCARLTTAFLLTLQSSYDLTTVVGQLIEDECSRGSEAANHLALRWDVVREGDVDPDECLSPREDDLEGRDSSVDGYGGGH
jgi:hypothetical protein